MRGSFYIPLNELPPEAFNVPGVRQSRRSGIIMVPWHAYTTVQNLGYNGGFKQIPSKSALTTKLAFVDDAVAEHPGLSAEFKEKATELQRIDLKRLFMVSGGVLDWPTGSGKTLLGLAFAAAPWTTAKHKPAPRRALAVVPASVTLQWFDQAVRWLAPGTKIGVIEQGRPDVRGIKHVTWDVKGARERLLGKSGADTLVLRDEWPDEELRDPERALLRKIKAARVERTTWSLQDDLGNRLTEEDLASEEEALALSRTWTPRLDYELLIVSWGLLAREEVSEALQRWDPTVLVVDEAHRCSKSGSLWTKEEQGEGEEPKFRKKLSAAANVHTISQSAGAVLMMTATPQGDRPRNWHGILDIYEPYSFGSYGSFVDRYCGAYQGTYGRVADGLSNVEELQARLRSFWIMRTKAETHKDLPPVIRQFVNLDLRHVGRGEIDMQPLYAEMREAGQGGSAEAISAAVAAEQKIPWIMDRLREEVRSGNKVFVWVAMRANARTLLSKLRDDKAFDEVPLFLGDGTSSPADRKAMVESFVEDPGAAIMTGTLGAFGEAIDGLQNIDVAYVLALPWTPQLLIQGPEGRHSRRGGTRSVRLVYVRLGGTKDDEVWSSIGEKLSMVALVRSDPDAAHLRDEIKGDTPERQAELLESLADMLVDWEREQARRASYDAERAAVGAPIPNLEPPAGGIDG